MLGYLKARGRREWLRVKGKEENEGLMFMNRVWWAGGSKNVSLKATVVTFHRVSIVAVTQASKVTAAVYL
ncbi:hypothetical protein E2C01_086074 [Portunus trituberculatus]|uniref:Uncharacterized protein n=1 Tax=Portunus trituberculatus TaxID=210409 RepID=A0A5B7IZT3_PORTR|nr:hypothetical protein [Portunus trituberculatus]